MKRARVTQRTAFRRVAVHNTAPSDKHGRCAAVVSSGPPAGPPACTREQRRINTARLRGRPSSVMGFALASGDGAARGSSTAVLVPSQTAAADAAAVCIPNDGDTGPDFNSMHAWCVNARRATARSCDHHEEAAARPLPKGRHRSHRCAIFVCAQPPMSSKTK